MSYRQATIGEIVLVEKVLSSHFYRAVVISRWNDSSGNGSVYEVKPMRGWFRFTRFVNAIWVCGAHKP